MAKAGPIEIDISLKIGTITVMRPEPGDKIIFSYPHPLSHEQMREITDHLAEQLEIDPAVNPVIVLDAGATLELVRTLKSADWDKPAELLEPTEPVRDTEG